MDLPFMMYAAHKQSIEDYIRYVRNGDSVDRAAERALLNFDLLDEQEIEYIDNMLEDC